MKYTERVAHNLLGCEAVSTGICGGCPECRQAFDAYTVREFDGSDVNPEPYWSFDATASPTAPGILRAYATEDEAEAASREAFKDDCSNGCCEGEAYFSRSECDICGSKLGGDREVWHYVADGAVQHGDGACVDCVMYLANGDVPAEVQS